MTVLRRTAMRLLLVLGWGASSIGGLAHAQDFDLQLPPKMSLKTEQTTEISVLASASEQVRFFANVGRVSDIRQEGERIVATYHVPQERYPQVAIIVVASPDLSRVDWGTIALYGQPTVKIRYGRRANVLVRAGEREFGPVQTDRRGRAELVVEVAPGVRNVTVFGADREGSTKERQNPLEVPEFERVFLLCPSEKRVLGFAIDESGNPLRDITLPLDADGTERTSHTRLESGATMAEFDVAEGRRDTFVVQSVAPGSEQPSRCKPPAGPSGFEVILPKSFVAGQGSVEVRIRPRYKNGDAPTAQAAPKAQTDFGELGRLRPNDGAFVSTWTIPDNFLGRSQAVVTVENEDGSARVRQKLPLRAAEAHELTVEIEDGSLRANGAAQTKISARLVDRHGNTAGGKAKLRAESAGQISDFAKQPNGVWLASYTAPRDGAGDEDVITIRELSRKLQAQVRLRLLSDRGNPLLSLRAGYITNFAKVSGPLVLLGLRYRLPFMDEMPVIGLDVGGYLSSSSDIDDTEGEMVDVDLFGVPALVRAGLSLPLGALDLFVHLAGGVLWSSADVRSQSSGTLIEDDLTFAIGAFVGSEITLGPGVLVVEAGYLLAPRGGTIGGQGAGLVADLGYGIAF